MRRLGVGGQGLGAGCGMGSVYGLVDLKEVIGRLPFIRACGPAICETKKHQPILVWPEWADVLSSARFSQKGYRLPDAVTVISEMSLLTALNRW
jgi:hypothetical protein